jgi:hypothetical protein
MYTQAIHTKDRHLLESVLHIGQEQIIIATVKRLQQIHVLPFLQLVLERFRAKPYRSVALLVWIRAVLVEHVAYLSTVRPTPHHTTPHHYTSPLSSCGLSR